jgi:tetratricopeptide (TPR) repeat protein
MRLAILASVLLASACSSALNKPAPLAAYAPGHANGRNAAQLVSEGNEAWARRTDRGQAKRAQDLYLDAAALDADRTDALLGALRALSYRIDYERGAARGRLAETAVALGQWCQRLARDEPECDYRLAIAIGQQARERPSTGRDAMRRMVALLQRAIAANPCLDQAGPHRVLALLLLRAPSWPVGPGDPDEALEHARAAVRLAPRAPANYLVLGEALAATGRSKAARQAYAMAVECAIVAREAGVPEARRWVADARAGLAKTAR